MIVVVAPGQGSQTPGFLAPWLEEPTARELLGTYGEAARVDLIGHGTESDADTIRNTRIAQPLIVGASLVSWAALAARAGQQNVGAVAGHSVGEFAAAAIAGVLDDVDAMRLVGERGRAMADAADLVQTGMSAVLGGDADELEARLAELGLSSANYNGGGQLVIAGELSALAALAENPPAKARVVPLQVAGAFHTHFMAPAQQQLAAAAADVAAADPDVPLYTNNTGARVAGGREFVDLLVTQVANPVRWDLTMESFAADGVTGIIELAPAGALVGLAKRGLKGVPTVAVKTPDDLAAAVEMLGGAA